MTAPQAAGVIHTDFEKVGGWGCGGVWGLGGGSVGGRGFEGVPGVWVLVWGVVVSGGG